MAVDNPMRDARQDETKGVPSFEFTSRFLDMSGIFDSIEGVPGNVVLCGVKNPESVLIPTYLVVRESEAYGIDPRGIFAYGSRYGWLEPSDDDKISPRNPMKGENPLKKDEIEHALDVSGIFNRAPELKVNVVGGDLRETVPAYDGGDIAFIYLDTNLKKETDTCLTGFYPRLVDGGALVLNNYHEFPASEEHAKHPAYAKNKRAYIGKDGELLEKWPMFSKVVDKVGRSNELNHIKGTTLHYLIK